ncbi:hypothetical protein DSC45_26515 [Streptomyces sp. YIM 130001]|uniref:hypothetical protein n=1 Tax=Streptomyces sp. YIM 130001 TaxID=2259644 RepID=UPI000E648497|nr:hypothetical protein [Streptomyces sp. YIM 130001]RII12422.1 hypothetical protein DSC45_26515 [Streptomyces sp. YIM 130001]
MSLPVGATPSATPTAREALARARSKEEPESRFPSGGHPLWPASAEAIGAAPPDGEAAPAWGRVLRRALAATGGQERRPLPSAGARYPVGVQLLVGPGGGLLAPGRYAYDPLTHRVRRRGPAPQDAPEGCLAVLTVAARRTVSHYAHRAFPLLLLDVGHALAALTAGGAGSFCTDADGALLSAAAGLPNSAQWEAIWGGSEPLHPLAAVVLDPVADAPSSALRRWAAQPLADAPLPADPLPVPSVLRRTWQALVAVADAGGAAATWSAPAGPVPERVIGARRSAEPPVGGTPARADLARVLVRAAAAAPELEWCVALGGDEVVGLRPGAEAAADGGPALRPLAPGDVRPRLGEWAAGQGWLAGTGAVLLGLGSPPDADAARIRRDHLMAGYAVGLAQLTATELGSASRPLGSWQPSAAGARLGAAPDAGPIVHGLALGSDG